MSQEVRILGRNGLKIQWPSGRAGSTPAFGTKEQFRKKEVARINSVGSFLYYGEVSERVTVCRKQVGRKETLRFGR